MSIPTTTPMKVNVKQTLLIGLGFCSACIAWAFYNFKLPIILNGIKDSVTGEWLRIGILGTDPWAEILGGFLMTFDNIAAILLQPYFGALSDRMASKYGRRTPFMMVGLPIAVLSLLLVPFIPEIFLFISIVIVFNMAMAFYRTPIMSLMPDRTPSHLRSATNSFISLMGGVGTVFGFLIPKIVSLIPGTDPVITGVYETQNYFLQDLYGFLITGILMLICLCIFAFTIQETPTGSKFFSISEKPIRVDIISQTILPLEVNEAEKSEAKPGFFDGMKSILKDTDKSALWINITVFWYLFGFNALEFSFGRFATSNLHISEGTASVLLAIIPIVLILFAIPAGRYGEKYGRMRTMKFGMYIVFGCVMLIILSLPGIQNIYAIQGSIEVWQLWPIILGLGIAGIGWGMININALPVVWQLAPKEKIGVYTGIYYMFSSLGAIISPLVMSSIYTGIRFLGGNPWDALFPYFGIAIVLSWLTIQKVKKGDAIPLTKEELALLKNQFSGDD